MTVSTLASINIGILGLGVVGSSLVRLLAENRDELIRKTGYNVIIRKIAVLNLHKTRACSLEGITLVEDVYSVIRDPKIDIVVELVGGIDLPAKYLFAAIAEGKHIITANKALIAKHGEKIFSMAKEKNVVVAFEAAVAGGLPIIKVLREGLSGNKIRSIIGILNGTSNFILSKMLDDGLAFHPALKKAQQLGYAEANPNSDIDGIDAVQKICILASLAFEITIQYEDVYTEGIVDINYFDLRCAKQMGYVIKHLAYAERKGEKIHLHVHPALVLSTHKLAGVDDVMNGVLIDAEPVGCTFFYGAGAGGSVTASALIADLIDVIRARNIEPANRTYMYPEVKSFNNNSLEAIENLLFSYYLRVSYDFDEHELRVIGNKYGVKILVFEKMCTPEHAERSTIIITDKVIESIMNVFIADIQNHHISNTKIISFRIHEHACPTRPLDQIEGEDFQIKPQSFMNTEFV